MHRIVDCDAFTREFLEGLGIAVPQPQPLPDDEFSRTREKVESAFSNSVLHDCILVNIQSHVTSVFKRW